MKSRAGNAEYCLKCSHSRSVEATRKANPLKRIPRDYPVGSFRAYAQMVQQWLEGTNQYDDCSYGNGARE